MNRRAALLLPGVVGLLLLTGLAIYLSGDRRPTNEPQPSAPAPAVAPAANAEVPAVTAPPAAPTPAPTAKAKLPASYNPHGGQVQATPSEKPGTLTYPDGSTRPALNGVGHDVTILWDTNRPYSPIRDVWRDPGSGWDFYRHEDGSLTTVHIVEVDGVPQVCPYTVHPEATVPLAPGAQQTGAPAPNPPSGDSSAPATPRRN